VSAAASSELMCSLTHDAPGRPDSRNLRASSSLIALSSTAACQDDNRRAATSTPTSSSSDRGAKPESTAFCEQAASTGPGSISSNGPRSPKPARCDSDSQTASPDSA
jgi:hypothetical protein